MYILRILLVAGLLLGLQALPCLAEGGQQNKKVSFRYKKAGHFKPFYIVYVQIGSKTQRTLLEIGQTGTLNAEQRARMVADRLTHAWAELPNATALTEALECSDKNTFTVWTVGFKQGTVTSVPHIVQVDGLVQNSIGQNGKQGATLIEQFVYRQLRKVASGSRAPEDPDLTGMKMHSGDQLSLAFDDDGNYTPQAEERLLLAISLDPDQVQAYETLTEYYSLQADRCIKEAAAERDKKSEDRDEVKIVKLEADKAEFERKAKSVKETLGWAGKAIDIRKTADDVYDKGKECLRQGDQPGALMNYDKAVSGYDEALQVFPQCVTYYYLRYVVHNDEYTVNKDVKHLVEARDDLVEAQQKLSGQFVVEGVAAGGTWAGMIEARIAKLDADIADNKK